MSAKKERERRQRLIERRASYMRDAKELLESIAEGDMENVTYCRKDMAETIEILKGAGMWPAVENDEPEMAELRRAVFAAMKPIYEAEAAEAQRRANAATTRQMEYLRDLGYQHDGSYLSKESASRLIDQYKAGHRPRPTSAATSGKTCYNCGRHLSSGEAMSGSLGTLCPDCYDDVESRL